MDAGDSAREEFPATTRTRIESASLEEFAAHGFHGARIARIAQRADVSPERIYAYFGNKDSMLLHTVRQVTRGFSEMLPSELESLADFARVMMQFFIENPQYGRVLAWTRLEARALLVEVMEEDWSQARPEDRIRELQARGAVASHWDPTVLTLAIGAICEVWVSAGASTTDRQRDAFMQSIVRSFEPG